MGENIKSQYIRSIELKSEEISSFNKYPFSIPVIKNIGNLEFHPEVTFIIGENGSGKSTILEAIAVAYGFNAEGGTKNFNFASKTTHSDLHQYIRIIKGVNIARSGFFFRAESFYNVATNIEELDLESLGNRIIDSYGGVSLHEQSHGESFLSLISNRFTESGIYILDEPEASLSPFKQINMIKKINELAKNGCQFIIATHSPIIMAYPNSIIYEINGEKIRKVDYENTQHYKVMSSFFKNKDKILNIILNN